MKMDEEGNKVMEAKISPQLQLSDLGTPNPEHSDYYYSVFDDERNHAFLMCETDDGWMVKITVPTAGAVSSVSQIFTLPEHWQKFLDYLHSDIGDYMVFGEM